MDARGRSRGGEGKGESDLIQIAIWLYRAVGAAVAIGVMELLAHIAQEPLSQIPFVTSIMLAFASPDSEPARPYAIIVGHLASCVAGFTALWCLRSGGTPSAVGVRG